jgi:hypothetical protein
MPMRCCRRRSGVATGRQQSRQRRGPRRYAPLPSLIAQAIEEIRQPGSSRRTAIGILDSDPGDALAAALASIS